MESPEIHYAGLCFRPFADSDAEAFSAAALESVETVGPWMPWCTADYSPRQALEWFAACRASREAGTAFGYGIFCQDSGEFLGGAGINDINVQNRFCSLGYWVRQSRQGQGIASRCVKALSAHAFQQLGLCRVEIIVAVGNFASEAVAANSGAIRECIARNRLQVHDQPVSAHVFSLVP